MGAMDAFALTIMTYASNFAKPEFASASASTFWLFTILFVVVFYKNKLSKVQMLGILIVLFSIFLLSLG